MKNMLGYIVILTSLLFACKHKEQIIIEETSPFKKISFESFNQEKKQITEQKEQKSKNNQITVKDTIFWKIHNEVEFQSNTRMFLGKVKSSEEIMWYMARDPSGKYVKGVRRYYVKESNISKWNFKIEFDSLGRKLRFIDHFLNTGRKNPTWGGS